MGPCSRAPAASSTASVGKQSSTAALVTFVELGSVNCIPCRMMQPIMTEIEQQSGKGRGKHDTLERLLACGGVDQACLRSRRHRGWRGAGPVAKFAQALNGACSGRSGQR